MRLSLTLQRHLQSVSDEVKELAREACAAAREGLDSESTVALWEEIESEIEALEAIQTSLISSK